MGKFQQINGSRMYSLENHGIKNVNRIYWNPSTATIYEEVIARREGLLAHLGALVVRTGHHTGRSPNDKFIVREPSSEDKIDWGDVNRPIEEETFDRIYKKMMAFLQGRDLFVEDCSVGADPKHQKPIRIITEYAWHNLFARNMFIRMPYAEEAEEHVPEYTVINAPKFHASPEEDGVRSESFILVHYGRKMVLIGGTSYAGETKKSIFSVMNYILPQEGVLPMHCSANIGDDGETALFFGLSGTGKTTLSADPERKLIGDDEHGWSEDGVFNFEGGCYAKVIRLSEEAEPDIYEATRRFGTILENVAIDTHTRRIDLDDDSVTENTRASYPITHIPNIAPEGMGGHPKNVVFLTCDAFGVMPPIVKLSPEQAMYHFLLGYTARVAGTEKGLGKEPSAVFSTCFGAPFMPLHPSVYAKMLGERLAKHKANCWLVNTGWSGGPYGVGSRMSIQHTRALLRAALKGELDSVETETHETFNLNIPKSCPGVPSEILQPKNTWKDKAAYDAKAADLARQFKENFKKYEAHVSKEVVAGGPK